MRSTAVFTATLRSCTTAGYCLPGSELALSWSPCVHVVRFLCVCPSCLGPVASPDSRPLASASPQPLSLGPRCSFWTGVLWVHASLLPRLWSGWRNPRLRGAECYALRAAFRSGSATSHNMPSSWHGTWLPSSRGVRHIYPTLPTGCSWGRCISQRRLPNPLHSCWFNAKRHLGSTHG